MTDRILTQYRLIRRNASKQIAQAFANITSAQRYGSRTKYQLNAYPGELCLLQEIYQDMPSHKLYQVAENKYCLTLGEPDERIYFCTNEPVVKSTEIEPEAIEQATVSTTPQEPEIDSLDALEAELMQVDSDLAQCATLMDKLKQQKVKLQEKIKAATVEQTPILTLAQQSTDPEPIKIPLLQHKTRPRNNSTICGYKDRPFSQYPYGWKWFAKGEKHRPGFDMGLNLSSDVNHVVPAESKFTEFVNAYLSRHETLTLKPSYCS